MALKMHMIMKTKVLDFNIIKEKISKYFYFKTHSTSFRERYIK